MAGDWIKWEVGLAEKPEVFAMASALGMDRFAVAGRLMTLWEWADRMLRDGNAPSVTLSFLDELARAPGFAQSMVSVGWLDASAAGISFPRFDRHNGKTAKSRALAKKRVDSHRAKNCNASVTPAPLPEKRREDITSTPPTPPRQKAPPTRDFVDIVWDAYPSRGRARTTRKKARDAWRRLTPKPSSQTLLAALSAWKASPDWRKDNGEFVPALHRWLRDRAFDDPPDVANGAAGASTPPRLVKFSELQKP